MVLTRLIDPCQPPPTTPPHYTFHIKTRSINCNIMCYAATTPTRSSASVNTHITPRKKSIGP